MRGVGWYVAISFFFLSLRIIQKIAKAIAPSAITPLTTPPAIAPTFVLLLPSVSGVVVLDGVAVDVAVAELVFEEVDAFEFVVEAEASAMECQQLSRSLEAILRTGLGGFLCVESKSCEGSRVAPIPTLAACCRAQCGK